MERNTTGNNRRKRWKQVGALLLAAALCLSMSACSQGGGSGAVQNLQKSAAKAAKQAAGVSTGAAGKSSLRKAYAAAKVHLAKKSYSGRPYIAVNGGKPYFTSAEIHRAKKSYLKFSSLDRYYRCGAAKASLTLSKMPGEDEERGDISSVHPSGWRSGMGWERCHLVGWQLSGVNAEPRNLITGTQYFNVTGMLPFENSVAHYLESNPGHHVLYRVTPVYRGKELIARGVLMEGKSVEDKKISFNIFVFNVQPGESINYKTGVVRDKSGSSESTDSKHAAGSAKRTYVVNTNTGKFHYPSCSAAKRTLPKNKETVKASRRELIQEGYDPCGICEP
ncbi:MAG: DNA/RNA non-specific endonuclease [Anaerovoracaceae bacterium]|jgi:DNA-entry nuclease